MFENTLHSPPAGGDAQALATLRVDVVADLVCPWCYLGKRRLDAALRAVHGPSEVHWYPYQINPSLPASGMPFDDYLSSRFGSREAVEAGLEKLRRTGDAEGIRFRFDRIERMPNTLHAHVLMYLAEAKGADSSAVADSLMSRFFEHGEDIADPEVLAAVGRAHGIDEDAVRSGLVNETTRKAILDQEAQMRRSGVAGVPAFLVNKHIFVRGAQDTDVLVNVFDRAMFGGDEEDADTPRRLH